MTPSSATGLEAAGVSVKPLEWHPTTDEMGKNGWCFHGVSAAGPSYVATVTIHGQRGELWEVANVGLYDTIDAAKAAAQADYEARIMSALSISDGEGAVAWRSEMRLDVYEVDPSEPDGKRWKWRTILSEVPPVEGKGVIFRNITPLFTHPAPVAAQPAEGWVLAVATEMARDDLANMLPEVDVLSQVAVEPVIASYAAKLRKALAATPPTAPAVPAEVREALTDLLSRDDIRHALEIARMGRPYSDVQGHLYMNERYKSHPGSDAQFTDYGLAHAACVLLNAADDILAALSALPAQPNSSEARPNHSPKLRAGLESAAESIRSRPPELRGSFKSSPNSSEGEPT